MNNEFFIINFILNFSVVTSFHLDTVIFLQCKILHLQCKNVIYFISISRKTHTSALGENYKSGRKVMSKFLYIHIASSLHSAHQCVSPQ